MLENLLNSGLLLGERQIMGRVPVSTSMSSLPMFFGIGLVSLVIMVLVVTVFKFRQRRNNAHSLHSPSDLWTELCSVHKLDKTDSQALRELAEARALEPAACLFVRADLWQLDRDTVEIRHLQPQLQKLQGMLFADFRPSPKAIQL